MTEKNFALSNYRGALLDICFLNIISKGVLRHNPGPCLELE